MARALLAERKRILVELPGDSLIELVIRSWLGLGVDAALPGIRRLAQRRATGRCDARGEVVMIRICVPHRARRMLWSLNLPLGTPDYPSVSDRTWPVRDCHPSGFAALKLPVANYRTRPIPA